MSIHQRPRPTVRPSRLLPLASALSAAVVQARGRAVEGLAVPGRHAGRDPHRGDPDGRHQQHAGRARQRARRLLPAARADRSGQEVRGGDARSADEHGPDRAGLDGDLADHGAHLADAGRDRQDPARLRPAGDDRRHGLRRQRQGRRLRRPVRGPELQRARAGEPDGLPVGQDGQEPARQGRHRHRRSRRLQGQRRHRVPGRGGAALRLHVVTALTLPARSAT